MFNLHNISRNFEYFKAYRPIEVILEPDSEFVDAKLKQLPILQSPKQLKHAEYYLFIVASNGRIAFINKSFREQGVTHLVLLKALSSHHQSVDGKKVLSAGEIYVYEDHLFISLSSGHFEPKFNAYTPILEALITRGYDYSNHRTHIQYNHYKTVDSGMTSMELDLKSIDKSMKVKQALLNCLSHEDIRHNKKAQHVIKRLVRSFCEHNAWPELHTIKNHHLIKQCRPLADVICLYKDEFPEQYSEYITSEQQTKVQQHQLAH